MPGTPADSNAAANDNNQAADGLTEREIEEAQAGGASPTGATPASPGAAGSGASAPNPSATGGSPKPATPKAANNIGAAGDTQELTTPAGAENELENTAMGFGDNGEPTSPAGGEGPTSSPKATKSQVSKSSPPKSSLTLAGLSASMGDLHHPPASYLHTLSGHKTAPQITLGARVTAGSFFRSSSNPGPGTYNNHPNEAERQSKFTAQPRFSFGGSSRFGLGTNPAKERPGPGHYGMPKDPGMERERRVGFGGAPRQSIAGKAGLAPGPGAYELRSSLGEGRMSTAAGRHTGSTVRSRMSPGPGAYDPTDRLDSKFSGPPKAGFGTSTRADFAAKREIQAPGPGTYDMHQQKVMGSGGPKSSMRSRVRIHDLASYIEPGPGHYGAHSTQFVAKEHYNM